MRNCIYNMNDHVFVSYLQVRGYLRNLEFSGKSIIDLHQVTQYIWKNYELTYQIKVYITF